MKNFLILLFLTTLVNGCTLGSNEKVVRKNKKAKTKEIVGLKNGVRNGSYSFFFQGKKQIDGWITNDLREGIWTFTPDEELRITGKYSNDKKSDYWYYYKNDTLVSKIYYDSLSQTDTLFSYYSNGITSGEVIKYHEQNRNDIIEYYPNSVIKQKFTQLNDKMEGICTRYDENGQLLLKLDYKNGVPFDLQYSVKSNLFIDNYSGDLNQGNGNLTIETTNKVNGKDEFILSIVLSYKDSRLDGSYKRYYKNGSIRCEGILSEGYLTGKWTIYSEYGSVLIEKNFIPDDKRGNFANVVVQSFYDDFNESMSMPAFPADKFSDFRIYISELIRNTEYGKVNDLREKAYVNLVISETGEVIKSQITKDGVEWTDFDDIDELNLMPLWAPGFRIGIPVKTQYCIQLFML